MRSSLCGHGVGQGRNERGKGEKKEITKDFKWKLRAKFKRKKDYRGGGGGASVENLKVSEKKKGT